MDHFTMDFGFEINAQDKACWYIVMGTNIVVNGDVIMLMVMVYLRVLMALSMKVSGEMISNMAKEKNPGQKEYFMKVSFEKV
jgi:hypothetical protein